MKRPAPLPFTWRGVELRPEPTLPGFYRSKRVTLGELLSADWRVTKLREGAEQRWHARLRIGAERFNGNGETAEAALDAAADEARGVAAFIRRLVPKGAA